MERVVLFPWKKRMRNLEYNIMQEFKDFYYTKNRLFRILSLLILTIFSLHIYILPSAFSVTLEEQARRRNKGRTAVADDEFNRKTPARREYTNMPQEKDPRLACLLSLILPGGGHIYLRNDLKGVAFFLLPIIGYSFAGYYLYSAKKEDSSGSEEKSKLVISGLLFLVSVIFHVVGIVEAYNDCIEINEKKFYYGSKKSKNPYIARLEIE